MARTRLTETPLGAPGGSPSIAELPESSKPSPAFLKTKRSFLASFSPQHSNNPGLRAEPRYASLPQSAVDTITIVFKVDLTCLQQPPKWFTKVVYRDRLLNTDCFTLGVVLCHAFPLSDPNSTAGWIHACIRNRWSWKLIIRCWGNMEVSAWAARKEYMPGDLADGVMIRSQDSIDWAAWLRMLWLQRSGFGGAQAEMIVGVELGCKDHAREQFLTRLTLSRGALQFVSAQPTPTQYIPLELSSESFLPIPSPEELQAGIPKTLTFRGITATTRHDPEIAPETSWDNFLGDLGIEPESDWYQMRPEPEVHNGIVPMMRNGPDLAALCSILGFVQDTESANGELSRKPMQMPEQWVGPLGWLQFPGALFLGITEYQGAEETEQPPHTNDEGYELITMEDPTDEEMEALQVLGDARRRGFAYPGDVYGVSEGWGFILLVPLPGLLDRVLEELGRTPGLDWRNNIHEYDRVTISYTMGDQTQYPFQIGGYCMDRNALGHFNASYNSAKQINDVLSHVEPWLDSFHSPYIFSPAAAHRLSDAGARSPDKQGVFDGIYHAMLVVNDLHRCTQTVPTNIRIEDIRLLSKAFFSVMQGSKTSPARTHTNIADLVWGFLATPCQFEHLSRRLVLHDFDYMKLLDDETCVTINQPNNATG
ncbi:hypothetical protein BDZ91DRAFT_766791 [Kalaharituber pfeilii]|nr:hypothetical protein BDZ91DRAFT_766791 [Kalaharituber pfeilii]